MIQVDKNWELYGNLFYAAILPLLLYIIHVHHMATQAACMVTSLSNLCGHLSIIDMCTIMVYIMFIYFLILMVDGDLIMQNR